MIVISTGCPASIGPEVSVLAAHQMRRQRCVLVGDLRTLEAAAELVGVSRDVFVPLASLDPVELGSKQKRLPRRIYVDTVDPGLSPRDRQPGKPSRRAGLAQLLYVERAAELARALNAPLVTAAVSKSAIAHCGERRAAAFRGHTEWLRDLDGAPSVTMCFVAPQFATSLVTTHLPLAEVPQALSVPAVTTSIVHLAELLARVGKKPPRVAVCSLNPHAGESELLGDEERHVIVPAIRQARVRLRGKSSTTGAKIVGPIGAETAYRLAANGDYDGVVAMYHDQATIPMKLIAFGQAVNVTMGLRYIRTSVDHGTAYDIAWRARANPAGMLAAVELAGQLYAGAQRTPRD